MSKNWTKGPWVIGGMSIESGCLSIHAPDRRIVVASVHNAASLGDFIVASMDGRRDFGAPDTAVTQYANADLMTAAPELYDALEAAIECGMVPKSSASEGGASKHSRQVQVADQIRAALAKARGES